MPSLHPRTAGVAGIIAISFALASHASQAGHGHDRYPSPDVDYARVVDVEPLRQRVTVHVPVRECVETTAYSAAEAWHDPPGGAPHRYRTAGGTIAGGVIGGVIGNRFGDGDGRDAMRLLGTLVGAAIGHDAAARHALHNRAGAHHSGRPGSAPYPVTECHTRHEPRIEERVAGYRVTYLYHGREYMTHTTVPPGDRIPVEVHVRPAY